MLTLKSVAYTYDSGRSLSFDLSVPSGCTYRVEGPNGSGKTTLMNLVAGILKPHSGFIKIDGRDVTSEHLKDRSLAYMQQNQPYFAHLTTAKTFSIAKIPSHDWQSYLSCFDLNEIHNRPVGSLSGGQRQIVLLGQQLLLDRKIILLDEPFSNLDENRKQIALSTIQAHIKKTNRVCLLSYH